MIRRTVAALLLVVAVGCGSSSPKAVAPTPGASFPATVGSVTIQARPTRIVSLSPTATEMLFAVGAGKQVVGVDDQSNYPAEAPKTKLSGYTPNVEAIAALKPDLVVFSQDAGGLVAGLAKLAVPGLLEPAAKTLDESYAQMRAIGKATGNAAEADAIVGRMRSEVESIVKSAPKPARSLTYYHELDPDFFSTTSRTFIGSVYSLLKLHNIADDVPGLAGDYPQLSAEAIVKADPDLVFLADSKCCGQSEQSVAARPGWSGLKAVKQSHVVTLDDDIASRWGPRIVELLRVVAGELKTIAG